MGGGITYNGQKVNRVTYNGVEVYSTHPPFLVRMRYDSNESTHVNDLVGGYTITTNTGGAVPAAADPFGGNNALYLNNLWIIYGGSKAIQSSNLTFTCWVKVISGTSNNVIASSDIAYNGFGLRFPSSWLIGTDNAYGSDEVTGNKTITDNEWHFIELSFDIALWRVFVDGVLDKTGTNQNLLTYNYFKKTNTDMWVGQFPWSKNYSLNYFRGCIYDFCILDGIWHTENYTVPTSYI